MEIDRNADVAVLEIKSSPDVSMDVSQEEHTQALDSCDADTSVLTTETNTRASSTASLHEDINGESDSDLEEPNENTIPIIIEEICPVDGTCVQCEIEQPCSFRFTDNGETLYVCNEPCIKAYQEEYPGKYTVTRKKYIIEEITPKTLLCSECEQKKTCYFHHNLVGEHTYYCSLNCLEGMMADEKDKYTFKPNSVLKCIDQIRSKEGQCLICEKVKPCEFSLVRYGEPRFLCKRNCIKILGRRDPGRYYIKNLRVNEPDVSNAIDKNLDEGYKIQAKAAAIVQREQSFHRKCSQCMLILMIDENFLTWEAMDFCDEICLERFQDGIGSRCAKCNTLVQHPGLGKYCVRLGYDIRQFCNTSCLEEFKKGLKICCYCRRDISASTQVFLARVGDKGQYGKFCAPSCVDKFEQMSKNPEPQPVWAKCAVCSIEKATTIEMKVTETASKQICSDPCFAAYKFVNNIIPDQCKLCKKYFERKTTNSFTTYDDSNPNCFCSLSCMTIHLHHTRFIVSCNWCKSQKYNFDMIRKVDNEKAVMMCSLNCLSIYERYANVLARNDVPPPTLAPPVSSIEQGRSNVIADVPPPMLAPSVSSIEQGRTNVIADVPPPTLAPSVSSIEQGRTNVIADVPPPTLAPPVSSIEQGRSNVIADVPPPTLAPPVSSIEQGRSNVIALAVEQLKTLSTSRKRRETTQSSTQEEHQRNESAKKIRFVVSDSPRSGQKKEIRSARNNIARGRGPRMVGGRRGVSVARAPLSSPPPSTPAPPPLPASAPTTSRRNRGCTARRAKGWESARVGQRRPSFSEESSSPVPINTPAEPEPLVSIAPPAPAEPEPSVSFPPPVPAEPESSVSFAPPAPANPEPVRKRPQPARRSLIPAPRRRLHDKDIDSLVNLGSEEDSDDDDDEVGDTRMVIPRTARMIMHDFDEEEYAPPPPPRSSLPSSPPPPPPPLPPRSSPPSSRPSSLPAPSSPPPVLVPLDKWHFEWREFPVPSLEAPAVRREPFVYNDEACGPRTPYQTPYDAFTAIWSLDIMELIVQQTNKYAQEVAAAMFETGNMTPDSRIGRWRDTNTDEMYLYFAVILATGITVKSRMDEYWAKDLLNTPFFSSVMPYGRFCLLSKCLHFADNAGVHATMTRPQAKLHKIQPIIDHLNLKFSELYRMSQNIALDESLTQWKGWLDINQFINNKAAKVGVKTYEICESQSGYLWRFEVHAGHDTAASPQEETPVSGLIPSLVLRLLVGLENQGYTVWMDNFYNSPALARELKSRGFDCVGTLRTNRHYVPAELASLTKRDMVPGQILGCTSGDVDCVVWRDKNRVALISTYHGLEVWECNGVRKPSIVLEYNICMGGVDRKDQMLALYPIERKRTRVWYKKLFRRLLNASVLNAFVMLKKNVPISHRGFRKELIAQLLSKHRSEQAPPAVQAAPSGHYPKEYACFEAAPGKRPQPLRKTCKICKKRTKAYCDSCDVPLCVFDCFKQHHVALNSSQ